MMQSERYLRAAVLRAFLQIAGGLAALFSLLSFVEQLALLGAGYGTAQALGFTLLTVPGRVVQVAPVAMLLASLLALGRLARDGELTALRSFGMAEARIVGAVAWLCLPLTVVLFVAVEFIVPPAQLEAQRLQAGAWHEGRAAPGAGRLWVARDGAFLDVENGTDGRHLHGVTLYRFHPDGTLDRFVSAANCDVAPDGHWILHDVRIKRAEGDRILSSRQAVLEMPAFITRAQIHLLALPVADMPPVELRIYVDELRHRHLPGLVYAQAFWNELAIPVSLLAMTMIAGPFVFGAQRSGSAGRQILVGTILGIVFVLVQQITTYLGLLLDLAPALSAFAPPLLLLAAAIEGLLRLEGRSTASVLVDLLQERVLLAVLRTQQQGENGGEADDLEREIRHRR